MIPFLLPIKNQISETAGERVIHAKQQFDRY
jgi:hypothetical protein